MSEITKQEALDKIKELEQYIKDIESDKDRYEIRGKYCSYSGDFEIFAYDKEEQDIAIAGYIATIKDGRIRLHTGLSDKVVNALDLKVNGSNQIREY